MRDDMESSSTAELAAITDGVDNVDISDDQANGTQYPANILIITNVSDQIFDNETAKREFEALFKQIDPSAIFHYLKSFRRARVVMSDSMCAVNARVNLHETEVSGQRIKCFFAQPIVMKTGNTSPHLHPPEPEKQFLISPPASPPVDWEPVREGRPVINYDLLAAMANLAPGESHELHAATDSHPGIVVHICEDPQGYGSLPIAQTRRPNMT